MEVDVIGEDRHQIPLALVVQLVDCVVKEVNPVVPKYLGWLSSHRAFTSHQMLLLYKGLPFFVTNTAPVVIFCFWR